MLTVVTFKYEGYRPVYNHRHVNALYSMVSEHLTIPHRMICITDDPIGIECEVFPLWEFDHLDLPRGQTNNYRCLKLFDIAENLGERLLVLDLDILIRQNIDSLITNDSFKILKGRAAPYNSSVYMLQSGNFKNVWSDYKGMKSHEQCRVINGRKVVGSDQAWISYKITNAPTWDMSHGIYSIGDCKRYSDYKEKAKIVQFAGGEKPWICTLGQLRREYNKYYGSA